MSEEATGEEEFRVEVELDDDEHHLTLGERLRAVDLDDEARERLGSRVDRHPRRLAPLPLRDRLRRAARKPSGWSAS